MHGMSVLDRLQADLGVLPLVGPHFGGHDYDPGVPVLSDEDRRKSNTPIKSLLLNLFELRFNRREESLTPSDLDSGIWHTVNVPNVIVSSSSKCPTYLRPSKKKSEELLNLKFSAVTLGFSSTCH
jgi:hypothetical protein